MLSDAYKGPSALLLNGFEINWFPDHSKINARGRVWANGWSRQNGSRLNVVRGDHI